MNGLEPIIIIFAVIGLILIIQKQAVDQESYLFANRQTGYLALVATLVMTELNPATLIAFSGAGYSLGFWSLGLPLVFLVGLSFYAIVVAKKWKEFNKTCVTEFFYECYGDNIGRLASVSLLMAMLGFSATYIKSLTIFFIPVLPLNQLLISLLLTTICYLIGVKGGLRSIIRLDLFSMLLVISLLVVCVLSTLQITEQNFVNRLPSIATSASILPGKIIFSLIVLTMFTYILAPWYGIKIFAARTEQIAYSAAFTAAILVFTLYFLAQFSTCLLSTTSIEITNSEYALPYILFKLLPNGIKSLALLIFFLIGATTLCGVWNAATATVIVALSRNKKLSYKANIFITLLLAIVSFILANTLVDNVFDKLILSNIPVAALSFALLAGFYLPNVTKLAVQTSIIVGLSWGVFAYLYWGESGGYTWYWSIYGIPLIFGTGSLITWVQHKLCRTSLS